MLNTKTYLHKVMENQCQILSMTQCDELLKLLQIYKEFYPWNSWYLEHRSIRLGVKRGYKSNLLVIEEKLDSWKRVFEYKRKSSYGIENINDMPRIHNIEVGNIAECNLLHDIISTPRRTKHLNRHYYPVLHGCMNT